MKPPQPIPAEVTQQVAEYFSILSEPMRLRLLNLLRQQERCVQELVEATQTSQANVSKHLKVMLQAGILSRRSEGTSAYYRVEDELIFQLCNLVCDRLAARIEQQARHFRAFGTSSQQSRMLEAHKANKAKKSRQRVEFFEAHLEPEEL